MTQFVYFYFLDGEKTGSVRALKLWSKPLPWRSSGNFVFILMIEPF